MDDQVAHIESILQSSSSSEDWANNNSDLDTTGKTVSSSSSVEIIGTMLGNAQGPALGPTRYKHIAQSAYLEALREGQYDDPMSDSRIPDGADQERSIAQSPLSRADCMPSSPIRRSRH